MDANGTRHHLVFGSADWLPILAASASPDLRWDPDTASVGLARRLPRVQRGAEQPLSISDRRGAAADRFGSWYWIDDDPVRIRVAPSESRGAGTYWSTGDLAPPLDPTGDDFAPKQPPPAPAPGALRGLAVTTHQYLVVGMLEPAGLLIFDLHAGGPPQRQCWPEELGFAPFDMAPAADGGVWILDLDLSDSPSGGAARYWKLDRYFRVTDLGGSFELAPERPADFKPVGGTAPIAPPLLFPGAVELNPASPLTVESPVAILELPDGSVLLLDNPPGSPFSLVHRFRDGLPVGAPVSLEGSLAPILDPSLAPGDPSGDPDLLAHDFAFLPAAGGAEASGTNPPGLLTGALFFAAAVGNQSFAFALRIEGDLMELVVCPRYLPMRTFAGKALAELCGELYYDFGEQWLPLTEHPRRRFEPRATLSGLLFDCRLPGCRWHRLLLDGCIPEGSAVSVASRAADDAEALAVAPWREEPLPYPRATGSELPFHRPFTDRELERAGTGTWELLLQKAEGRLLELRVTLASDGRTSPRLRALRVYYPRFSYLDEYLPALYRADPDSAFLLDRFLANTEGLYTEIEDEIAAAQVLLDSRTAPPEYLDWLAGWLGAELDPLWDEARRRLFLAHAPLLFRWRATPLGLLALIRLSIEPCPDASIFDSLTYAGSTGCAGTSAFGSVRVVERFQTRALPAVVLGDPTTLAGPSFGGGEPWQPAMGATVLHLRYGELLRTRYRDPIGSEGAAESATNDSAALARLNAAWGTTLAAFAEARLSPVVPTQAARAADWRAFITGELVFPYAEVTGTDTGLFREFLAQRYSTLAALNAAHGRSGSLAWTSFDSIALPAENAMPEGGTALVDWIDFVSLFVPINRTAHRFTVLVPTEPGEPLAVRDGRLNQVREIVLREKPAHTSFDVKPYWALFQVGGARLGLDTVLGEGSRFVALVLGSTYLGESFLAESHPWNVDDRFVLGRDASMEN